ncbi:MAG: PCRF domain-containing protein, partial [Okeania sp. SIO2H7]|nr:PCRF domain-containing protein [Okeania sp. SIO2H7]
MTETYLLEKLKSVEQTFKELTRRLADPDIARDPNEYQEVAKARSSLEEVVNTFEEWKNTEEELKGAKEVLKE